MEGVLLMRLKDFLNEKELEQFEELQFELLEAHNKKQRLMIQAEIDELICVAQSRYDSLMNGNGRQEPSSIESPKRLKDLLTEEEDIKLQELKMELLVAPNDKVRTMIMTQINEILDSAENRYNKLDKETRFSTMHPIKFTIGSEPDVYKLYKLENEEYYTYMVLVIKDGELITETWPIEEVERNINNGVWKEVK
jgi:hypothetical protein